MLLLGESEAVILPVMLVLQESLPLRFDRVPSPDGLNHPQLGKQTQVRLVAGWAARQGLGGGSVGK